MNIDEAAQKAHINLDADKKSSLQDELSDVLDHLKALHDFKPRRERQPKTITLRDDEPRTHSYHSTSIHRVDDNIKAPRP